MEINSLIERLRDWWTPRGKKHNDAGHDAGADVLAAAAALEAQQAELEVIKRDPLSEGWKRAEEARRDRAAAVSQWKAAKERAERAEAESARLMAEIQTVIRERDLYCVLSEKLKMALEPTPGHVNFVEWAKECRAEFDHAQLAEAKAQALEHELMDAEAERDALAAENAVLRKDAGRYRWLRDVAPGDLWDDFHGADDLDAAIDKARTSAG